MSFNNPTPRQDISDMIVDPPVLNMKYIEAMGQGPLNFSRRSFNKFERIMHSHGATLQELFQLNHGRFQRYVDMVVYPITHDQCDKLVKLAFKFDVAIVPYGGGTNVT